MPIQWLTGLLLVVLATFLTIRFAREDGIKWKLIRFVGILVSTIPIIGLIQAYYASSRSRDYSVACACQALSGIVAFSLMSGVFHVFW
jgi:hypothetical protein